MFMGNKYMFREIVKIFECTLYLYLDENPGILMQVILFEAMNKMLVHFCVWGHRIMDVW